MKTHPPPRRMTRKVSLQPSTLPDVSAAIDYDEPRSLKAVPIIDDHMTPTLEPGDLALIEPVRAYRGAGIYVLRIAGHDGFEVIRVERDGDRRLRLQWDNTRAGGLCDLMTIATFTGLVVGKLVGRVRPITPADRPMLHRLFLS